MGEHAEPSGSVLGRTVAEVLAAMQSTHRFALLHGVLLGGQTATGADAAHVDHVIVDQSGVLAVEVMTPRRAVITGRYTDRAWGARYPEGRTEVLPNPIRENDHRVGVLHESLTRAGSALSLDHVRGIAVFVDCDISLLELDSVNTARVCGVDELPERYARRIGFAGAHPLSSDEVAGLAQTIQQLDRSSSTPSPLHPFEEALHPEPAAPDTVTPVEPDLPSRQVHPERRREVILLAAGLSTLLVLAIPAVGLVRSFASREPVRLDRPPPTRSPAPAATSIAPAIEEDTQVTVRPDMTLAKKRLQQTFPERYDQVTDLDHPDVSNQVEGQITYRWEYVARAASNAISVGTVSITLDAAGTVIGSE